MAITARLRKLNAPGRGDTARRTPQALELPAGHFFQRLLHAIQFAAHIRLIEFLARAVHKHVTRAAIPEITAKITVVPGMRTERVPFRCARSPEIRPARIQ